MVLVKIFEEFNPNVGGLVLLVTKPYKDGHSRLFVSSIIEWMEYPPKSDSGWKPIRVRIDKYHIYHLREVGDQIYGYKVDMTQEEMSKVFGMSTEYIYLNDNKTPLWQSTIKMRPNDLLKTYKDMLKPLVLSHNIVYKGGKIK